jgi:membrane fusion protein, multidrug efflux system
MSTKNAVLDREPTAPAPPQPKPAEPATNTKGRRRAFQALGVIVLLAAAAYGANKFLAPPSEDTDDAYVGGNVISITARNGGTVIALHADNTQQVGQGEALIDLDPALPAVDLAAAEANLGRAVRIYRANSSAVAEATAEIARSEAEVDRAVHDLQRRKAAVGSGAVSAEEVNHAADALHCSSHAQG